MVVPGTICPCREPNGIECLGGTQLRALLVVFLNTERVHRS
jgi:hypothetical protein